MEPPPPQYWMWNGTNNNKSLQPLAPPPNPSSSSFYEDQYSSWEEQAFAEDAAGPHGGCVWPPRSYSCTFCRREFRSAQALGGHMNVHRRDRARLKQSPIHPMEIPIQSSLSTSPPPSLSYHFSHNPYKPPPDLPTSNNPNRVSTDNNCSEKSFFPSEEEIRIKRKRPPNHQPCRSNQEDEMTSLNLVLRQSSQSTASSEEDEVAMGRAKRRRIDDTTSLSLPFMFHEIRNDNNSNKKISVGGCAREELDLELRLGSDRPQVKSI